MHWNFVSDWYFDIFFSGFKDLSFFISSDLFFGAICLFCKIFLLFAPVVSLPIRQSLLGFHLFQLLPWQILKPFDRTSFNRDHRSHRLDFHSSYFILETDDLSLKSLDDSLLAGEFSL